MKPLLFVTLEYPPQIGGIAVYLSRLVESLPAGRTQVMADVCPKTHETDMRCQAPIYRRQLLPGWIRPRWLGALYWTDWFCRKEGRPEAIIVSHLLPMGLVADLMRRFRRVPYAVIIHGMDAALALAARGSKRRSASRVVANAALVVANSSYTARLAETLGAAKSRITIVHPCPQFQPQTDVVESRVAAIRVKYGLSKDFTLISVGRLVKRKGFDTAIKAVAELKRSGRQVRLVIVGDGPEKPTLQALSVELDAADRVVFTGIVSDEELAELYAAAHAFMLLPRSLGPDIEGFGIVYLEANLFGLPAIASRTAGVPDAVLDGETGLLVEPDDHSGAAYAVGRLMDDPGLRRRLGDRGRARVREEFTWEKQAAKFTRALETALGTADVKQ
ncbi:MAG: glycosyltransferase family 4 protein [Patescibacteria group bacterium]|jgi:phosphatidylinositol alpha-1,6-mannosyltransferase